jgi:hypothetical protein
MNDSATAQANQTRPTESAGARHDHEARPSRYATFLDWLFTISSATRLLTYLPTMWAIYANANSSQHSLLTWCGWLGANASMAAWLYEGAGRKLNRAVVATAANCVMCLATCLLIWAFR